MSTQQSQSLKGDGYIKNSRCGYIAIVGRPNVGKSTLLNHLLNKKISITSRKPQTTRHRILGIKTINEDQYIYVDTPGLHPSEKKALNRYMNRVVRQVLPDVDVIIFMVDARVWREQDSWVLEHLQSISKPVILVINKVDRLKDRQQLLPYLEKVEKLFNFVEIVPISAKNCLQISELEAAIAKYLPKNPHFFLESQITDRPDQFIMAERIREKLMRLLGEEIPYALTVTIDALSVEENIIRVAAIIWVEKMSQKGIVIGKQGNLLKRVGQEARLELERYFDKKIFLQLWVKVKNDWSDSEALLHRFGYGEE